MSLWVRFEGGFGVLNADTIAVHDGDMFGVNAPTGEVRSVTETRLLAPVQPGKFIGLWNNFHAVAARTGHPAPDVPLYFLKATSAIIGPEDGFRAPPTYTGRVVYEGELGLVIGTRCFNVSEAEADAHIFGYTCVNDITAADLFFAADPEFPSFPQWARAKGCEGFGPIGPAIATRFDPKGAAVKVTLNGRERQNYPLSDLILPPARIGSLLSRDMTLMPGDVIACGTSVNALPMRPGMVVEVSIEGIGTLRNHYLV
jgi:2-keto-4-pentenoate hydratase/2-oxohepta-3-ene-1,7-dioic acid hydratase in catechol pathway